MFISYQILRKLFEMQNLTLNNLNFNDSKNEKNIYT